jgi:hypothetical protein
MVAWPASGKKDDTAVADTGVEIRQAGLPRVIDDSIRARQLSHHQFSWTAGESAEPGLWTLQLLLDEGAWEEVLTVHPDDAHVMLDMLRNQKTVYYDTNRRVSMFGSTKSGK